MMATLHAGSNCRCRSLEYACLEPVDIAVLIELALEDFFNGNHCIIGTGLLLLEGATVLDQALEFFDERLEGPAGGNRLLQNFVESTLFGQEGNEIRTRVAGCNGIDGFVQIEC